MRTWRSAAIFFPAVSPRAVRAHWRAEFQAHADRILDALARSRARRPAGRVRAAAFGRVPQVGHRADQHPLPGHGCVVAGDDRRASRTTPAMRRSRRAAMRRPPASTRRSTTCCPWCAKTPNHSLLSVMIHGGMPEENVRHNIKLTISGGQNEPRKAIAGCIWALLTHPEQFARVREGKVTWLQVFEEFARWISPIGMSPRRIAKAATRERRRFRSRGPRVPDVRLGQPRRGAFRRCGSVRPDARYGQEHRVRRGPAFLRGRRRFARDDRRRGAAERVRAAEGLALDEREPVRIGGWAFRGLLNLPVVGRAARMPRSVIRARLGPASRRAA